MYALMVLTALSAPGHLAAWGDHCCAGWGWGWGWGGYAHGYGLFWPAPKPAGGVVLPPSWPADPTPWCDGKIWYDYVMQLEGQEREDMICVWEKATPCARKRLLTKLGPMITQAAIYRAQVERERAIERYRVENRPMSDEEVQLFETYYLKLRGLERKVARDRWRDTDNRGRRLYLKEILRDEDIKERQREDDQDMEDEIELQKEKVRKAKEKKDKEEKAKKAKEEKDKKDKEEKDKKDKEEKDKKDL
jgi:hypothetical protein